MIIWYVISHTVTTLSLLVISAMDKVRDASLRDQDTKLLTYCMERELVICPRCRIAFRVTGLDEQMNVEWKCGCCGCEFREYPTHTKET